MAFFIGTFVNALIIPGHLDIFNILIQSNMPPWRKPKISHTWSTSKQDESENMDDGADPNEVEGQKSSEKNAGKKLYIISIFQKR